MGHVNRIKWDALARTMREPQFQEHLALHKRRENLDLISAWAPNGVLRVLKTDLFEEAFGKDALLDALVGLYPTVVGMDISHVVTAAAKGNALGAAHVVSDTCVLPFRTESFDLIVSISTLDHLPPGLLPEALGELCRVLSPAGCLILTLDSRHNPLHVLSNHVRRWMRMIYAERCYTVNEVVAALARHPVVVTEVTAIYHVPFPVNFLAKALQRRVGARSAPWILGVVRMSRGLAKFRTRFFTGRYIALRIVKDTTNGGGRVFSGSGHRTFPRSRRSSSG